MSKRRREAMEAARNLNTDRGNETISSADPREWWKNLSIARRWFALGIVGFLAIGILGAGVKYFGESTRNKVIRQENLSLAKNESMLPNSTALQPTPVPTLQVSRDYIYSGSRLLAVEDAAANAIPPADLAVWRPSTGVWWVLGGPGSQQTAFGWGLSDDKTVPGDYDGDGKTDFCVYRPSNGIWYIVYSSSGLFAGVSFGINTDIPTPADYDGDGKTDVAVFRPNAQAGYATWYILQSSNGSVAYNQYGLPDDTPFPADYDGDGKADVSVWRNSAATFYSVNSSNGALQQQFYGATNDMPVSADYDGDGKADYAVWSTNIWRIRQSSNSQTVSYQWGNTSIDKPVQNDYDGDGKVDVAIWRATSSNPAENGDWWILQSSNGQPRVAHWGMTGDIPVPAYYRR